MSFLSFPWHPWRWSPPGAGFPHHCTMAGHGNQGKVFLCCVYQETLVRYSPLRFSQRFPVHLLLYGIVFSGVTGLYLSLAR